MSIKGLSPIVAAALTMSTLGGGPWGAGVRAGEVASAPDGGVTYEFRACEKPDAPVLATDSRSSGRVTRAARNRAIDQYNDYVAKANAYMRCLSDEASRDLEAYYAAVAGAQKSAQDAIMGEVEEARAALGDGR
ncbi:MAG: hypothetical protein AAFY22_04820 [Pseudomonadota bacterium]